MWKYDKIFTFCYSCIETTIMLNKEFVLKICSFITSWKNKQSIKSYLGIIQNSKFIPSIWLSEIDNSVNNYLISSKIERQTYKAILTLTIS